jgi:hypothetical protein
VDHIHLNEARQVEHEGRAVILKRRRLAAGTVMGLANLFFRLARNPVEALTRGEAWRPWEVECFQRLHGPEFSAGVDAAGRVWIDVLPGGSLAAHLQNGTLSAEMLAAAATELRRAHGLHSPHYDGAWSHGDPHTGNLLFDAPTGRARLIDFEVRHLRKLGADARHADDLLVLLQDVCGRCPAAAWPELAESFLRAYGRTEITSRLRDRLRIPAGVPRVWWAVRTTWMGREELDRRLQQLSTILRGLSVG